jgi:hypothetical protein
MNKTHKYLLMLPRICISLSYLIHIAREEQKDKTKNTVVGNCWIKINSLLIYLIRMNKEKLEAPISLIDVQY